MEISTFVSMSGVTYSWFQIGSKGDCANFALLGRCLELCPYKHIARPVAEVCACTVKEALKLGLKRMATKASA